MHYPKCVHKILSKHLIQVHNDLVNSYMDDLNIGTSLKDIENKIKEHTFEHKEHFDELRLIKKAETIVIAKSLKVLHVLDFNGFSIKKFHSTSFAIQKRPILMQTLKNQII